jgi:hypothetical protein
MIEHNDGWHTLPEKQYGSFLAMFQGAADGLTECYCLEPFNEYGPMMYINTSEGVVYITKEQARVFFGFQA